MSVRNRLREEGLPAEAEVECQSRRYLPTIGEVQVHRILAGGGAVGKALEEGDGKPQHEVSHAEPCPLAIESKLTAARKMIDLREPAYQRACAEGHLMRSPDESNIVVE